MPPTMGNREIPHPTHITLIHIVYFQPHPYCTRQGFQACILLVRNLGHLPGKKICILYELGNKMQVKSGGHCESLSGFTEEPQGKAP